MKVDVDVREQNMVQKSLIFFKKQKIIADKKMNEDGDLVFHLQDGHELYIERKTYCDFLSSYISGHLQEQCIRMNQKEFFAVIVYGNVHQCRNIPTLKHINQNSVQKMVGNIMLMYKTPVFFVDNEISYLRLSLLLAQSVEKNYKKSLDSTKISARVKSRPDLSMLMAQPAIGQKKAEMLLDNFGSVKNVLYADREELLKIKGVGKSMVANIKELKEIYENGMR